MKQECTKPNGTNLILHSVQGWYYQKMLKDKRIRQSMGCKGNCLKNAVMENFLGLTNFALLTRCRSEVNIALGEERKKSFVEKTSKAKT